MYLWPHQLQKTNDKKSNLCCMKKRGCSTDANLKTVRANFLNKITPYVSMVDTDQEKEAQSILSAKSRNHSVEEKEEEKERKKEKEKRKWKNEFVLHELTKAVLKLHTTKWSGTPFCSMQLQNSFRQFMQDKLIFPFSFFFSFFFFYFFFLTNFITNWKDKHKPRECNQTQKVTGTEEENTSTNQDATTEATEIQKLQHTTLPFSSLFTYIQNDSLKNTLFTSTMKTQETKKWHMTKCQRQEVTNTWSKVNNIILWTRKWTHKKNKQKRNKEWQKFL